MSTLVMKLGGHVLSSHDGLLEVLKILESQDAIWDNLIVVTSALSGVTDTLHDLIQIAEAGNANGVRNELARLRDLHIESARHGLENPRQLESLIRELDVLLFELSDDFDEVRQKRFAPPPVADRILAMGERLIIRMLAAAGRAHKLRCVALDTSRLIVTDDRHFNARPIFNLSQQNIEQNLIPLLHNNIIPIVTGYIGATQQGAITTLGRGGSDYSATYLGALLKADEIWLFSDVKGLMTADPALVENARVLTTSSYNEVAEMAYFGARVLHPRAIQPLIQNHIPLRIRSIHNLDSTGTYIYAYATTREQRIRAVTQVAGVMVAGPSQSNMADACNRLISQYLLDEVEPTLQLESHSGSVLVYISPTSANQASFQNCIYQLQSYESGDEWQVQEVVVIAVIGSLKLVDQLAVLNTLNAADITPIAYGPGLGGIFLLAVSPDQANLALNRIHSLIS